MPGIMKGLTYIGIWFACSSIVLVATNPQNSVQESLVITHRRNGSGSISYNQDQHRPMVINIGGKHDTHHYGGIEKGKKDTELSEMIRNPLKIEDQGNKVAVVVDGFRKESSNFIDRLVELTNRSIATTVELRSSFDQMSASIASIDRSLAGITDLMNKTLARSEQMLSAQNSTRIQLDEIKSSQSPKVRFRDCWEIYQSGNIVSCIHEIRSRMPFAGTFSVYCNMDAHGGGWTVFQNRMDGSVNFNQSWNKYKDGFGSLDGEFWLGLERIHQLTNAKRHELLIELEDFDEETRFAVYDNFVVSSEEGKYSMQSLGSYTGTAGDSLSYHKGKKFSTWDQDNDSWDGTNCAVIRGGGWWHQACGDAVLNARYIESQSLSFLYEFGIEWDAWRGIFYSYKKTRMSIRPLNR